MNRALSASAEMHGGRLQAARLRYPHAPEPFLDLSTGINPVSYPLPALSTATMARLPEPEQNRALREAACIAYGLATPDLVVPCPGTQSVIGILPFLFRSKQVAVLGPTYTEHRAAWHRAGHAVRECTSLAECAGADIVVLCNPNNPTGAITPPADLLRTANVLSAKGGLLVVDEAFADFAHGACSVAAALPHKGLIVLRSFGKTYGLAGLRLGFALAAPALAAHLRGVLGPWPVSGPAIAAGCAALPDTAWRDAAGSRLAADATRLDTILTQARLRVAGGTPLFRLAAHNDAATIHDRLANAGILTRIFPDHPDWLRVGIPPDAAAFERLARALA